jgi:hypothetical protein
VKKPFKRKLQLIQSKKLVKYSGWIPYQGDILKLNVSGKIFVTSRSTLCKYPKSVLAEMFSKQQIQHRDDRGAYFIDRNPEVFQHVLTWLRYGTFPGMDSSMQHLVTMELMFWNLVIDKPMKEVEQVPIEESVTVEQTLTNPITPISTTNQVEESVQEKVSI